MVQHSRRRDRRRQPYVGYKDDPEWLKALPLGNGSLGAMVLRGCPQRTHPTQ